MSSPDIFELYIPTLKMKMIQTLLFLLKVQIAILANVVKRAQSLYVDFVTLEVFKTQSLFGECPVFARASLYC